MNRFAALVGVHRSTPLGLLLLLTAIGASAPAPAVAQQGCLNPPGDITADGNITVVDVQCTILQVLYELGGSVGAGPACVKVPTTLVDLNCDDARTVADVQLAIAYTLGQPLSAELDADANKCPDSCEIFIPECGDGLCTEGTENCFTCPQDCGACVGDCCAAHPSAGCEVSATTLAVCSEEPTCCTAVWSAGCAALAAELGACPGDCCAVNPTPSCDQPAVASCVCALDATCCSAAWDADCVALAQSSCGIDCPIVSDCCSVGEVGGCTSFACESCVCALDSFCCDTVWDATCVGIAGDECAFEQVLDAVPQGSQHNPPVPTPATGTAQFTLNGNQLSYVITYQNLLAPELYAHIHQAPPGEPGPIVIPLPDGTPKIGTATLTPALMEALFAGDLYINIHSTLYPDGELRGQISVSVVDGPCFCEKPCCGAHPAPGCDEPNCEACVCAADMFCCAASWDSVCEELARQDCATECGCGTGDCCAADGTPGCSVFPCESCVCAADSFCCDVTWDELCVAAATTECASECNCGVRSCCEAQTEPGCSNPGCVDCVCALDGFCCDVQWDSTCVGEASADCNGACACAADDCCVAHGGEGCAAPACSACVCGADPFCCTSAWDELCVAAAFESCNLACGCDGLPGTETCCGTHGSAGCDNLPCQKCVCGQDSFCCEAAWDALCVTAANGACAAQCACGAEGDCCSAHAGSGCENPACEGCVCGIDAFCCAVAWDGQCVDTASVECNGKCLCDGDSCCVSHTAAGCGAPACEACVCAADAFCCAVSWDELCVTAAFGACADGCQCGTEPGTGACCTTHSTAGCNDAGCQQCVCGNDAFCCTSAWDAQCLGLAAGACEADCGCASSIGGCCTAHSGPSCNSQSCSACVCDAEPSCCSTAWTSACASIAALGCDAACGCAGPDCCQPQSAEGCGDAQCETCVCAGDSFCCDVQWDELCVGTAENDCAPACDCATP